ncbi:recombinase family protein [Pseudomonas sp.]|uniref:recombinase family protein n=1 Tax=Pseudomonas sp. TaxID=306 RepID=UPI0028B0F8A0|nr:recombinase family protein [Pseudomonas sp.]
MPSAIPYIRFSSARQNTGSSAERQQQMVTQWLTQHPDYTQSNLTYEDLGRSGYHGEHVNEGGGFAKLLQAVKAESIKAGDVVLVEAIDRTGRLHPLDMLNKVITPILAAGVSIITLDDGVTYTHDSAASGHLFLLVAKIQAAYGYSKSLSERTKASYVIRREQAKATGEVKRHTPIWLTSDGKLKDEIAIYIEQAFTLYVSGVGKTTIANRLRASGVPELATCSGPTVEAWLRNKTTIGYWNEIPNVYPPVVSNELFAQAQQRKKAVATKPRERTSKHFLVGLVKCGVCGSSYIIHYKDGKPNNMRCGLHHRLKSAGCVNAETIPYQVVIYVYSLTATHWVDRALQVIQLTANEKRKLELKTEYDTLSSSISRLTKLLAKVDDKEVEAEFLSYSERRKIVEDELEVLGRTPNADMSNVFNASVTEDRMIISDPVQLSALLRQAGYVVTVYRDKLIQVADEVFPWKYLGIKRKTGSNETLGYRVLHLGDETIISPDVPETPDWGEFTTDPVQGIRYILRRSYKLISIPTSFDYPDHQM